MKKLLTILLLVLSLTAQATVYYVSPRGNDTNTGTDTISTSAWLTWQKGFSTIVAGDTLYILGGTYSPTETVFSGYDNGAYAYNRDGTSGNLITVMNYPSHTPIMNATNVDGAYTSIGVYLHSCDYWLIKGLIIQNCPGFGMELQSCTNVTVERCVFRYNIGSGFRAFSDSDDILVLNCDAHHNINPADPQSPDGFEASNINYRAGHLRLVTFRGCRAWENSDDGFDHWNMAGELVWDGCWAWRNGFYGTQRNGDGFKMGPPGIDMSAVFSRTITNCLAWQNSLYGISQNSGNTKYIIKNNTSILNQGGFNLWWYDYADTIANNISCLNTNEEWNGTYVNRIIYTNSYDHKLPLGPVADANDFLSLDTTGVSGARQADGSLPVLNFAKLASSSDLIDAGTDVAIAFLGSAPDIGFAEYVAESPAVAPTVTTTAVTLVYPTSAKSGGNVTNDGAATITARGVCWSTTTGPTTSDSHTTDAGTTGSYVSTLTGLTKGETYFVRAYATNSAGTSYGEERTFTTPAIVFIVID